MPTQPPNGFEKSSFAGGILCDGSIFSSVSVVDTGALSFDQQWIIVGFATWGIVMPRANQFAKFVELRGRRHLHSDQTSLVQVPSFALESQ